jgi:hypothetical protein
MVVDGVAAGERRRLKKWLRPTSFAGDSSLRSAAIKEEWAVVLRVDSMEEEGAGWWCSPVNQGGGKERSRGQCGVEAEEVKR